MLEAGDRVTLLAVLTRLCLALPEAQREDSGRHAQFTVRGKKFAYFLDDHHGDGMIALACRAPAGKNEELLRLDPVRFFMPAYLGPRGWIGVRLDIGEPDWTEIAGFVADSYRLAAPKRLTAALTSAAG